MGRVDWAMSSCSRVFWVHLIIIQFSWLFEYWEERNKNNKKSCIIPRSKGQMLSGRQSGGCMAVWRTFIHSTAGCRNRRRVAENRLFGYSTAGHILSRCAVVRAGYFAKLPSLTTGLCNTQFPFLEASRLASCIPDLVDDGLLFPDTYADGLTTLPMRDFISMSWNWKLHIHESQSGLY